MAAQMRRRLFNRNDAVALVLASFYGLHIVQSGGVYCCYPDGDACRGKPPQTEAVSPSCLGTECVRKLGLQEGRRVSALVTPDTAGK